jgi:hypothetical protein
MIISIIQPSFLPWLGYFEQIALSDVFVYLDDVQYTRKDWRSRNRLKSPNGAKTVSVPVIKSPRDTTLIKDARIAYEEPWQENLLNQIREWYRKAKYFRDVFDPVAQIVNKKYPKLVELNYGLNNFILDFLGISRPIFKASEVPKKTYDKNLRIIEICKQFDAHILYDGKSAEVFIDKELFRRNGIDVIFQDYHHTPYPQLWGEFIPYLSVLDLMMNCGKGSIDYILSGPVPKSLIR